LGLDVRSLELYYHNPCHNNFTKKYDDVVAAEECGSMEQSSALMEYVAIAAIKDHVDSSCEERFQLKDLENIYLEKLAEHGKEVQSHMTRFVSKLKEADVELTMIQMGKSTKFHAVKTERLKTIIPDSDWIQILRKVVEPIRDEIIEVHRMQNFIIIIIIILHR
jgi:hypothetical protein